MILQRIGPLHLCDPRSLRDDFSYWSIFCPLNIFLHSYHDQAKILFGHRILASFHKDNISKIVYGDWKKWAKKTFKFGHSNLMVRYPYIIQNDRILCYISILYCAYGSVLVILSDKPWFGWQCELERMAKLKSGKLLPVCNCLKAG